MMRIFPWLLIGLLCSVSAAEESVTLAPKLEVKTRVMPWIGLHVGKLEPAMRAHAPDVPDGTGFLVTVVDEGGPAMTAGVKPYDVLWKMGDQLLVNEAQLGTLLRLRKPGETVELSLVRSGKQLNLELILERWPDAGASASVSPMEIPLVPTGVKGMPKQIIYPQSKTAELSREDGAVATLHYEGEVAQVRIVDAKGEEIYAGPTRMDGKFCVPEEWKCSVGALLRSMHEAGKSDRHPQRPRPRVVIPSESKER